jgi:hypothetical protein
VLSLVVIVKICRKMREKMPETLNYKGMRERRAALAAARAPCGDEMARNDAVGQRLAASDGA